jgi:hypothetical protein
MVKALWTVLQPNICTKKYERNLGYSADENMSTEAMLRSTKEFVQLQVIQLVQII